MNNNNSVKKSKVHKSLKVWGIFFIAFAVGALALLCASLPFGYTDINDISPDDIQNGELYHIDDIEPVWAYAELTNDSGNSSYYYYASFVDGDGQKWIVSLDPNSDKELKNKIIGNQSGLGSVSGVKISGYFDAAQFDEGRQELYFENDALDVALDEDAKILESNLKYVCASDESYFLNSISFVEIILLIFALACLYYGIQCIRGKVKLKKQNQTNEEN